MQSLFQRYKWMSAVYRERRAIDQIELCSEFDKGIILIPHADDEWIGCSQLIINSSQDIILCNMDMPGGDTSELHKKRREELEKISSIYKRELITLENNKENSLMSLLSSYAPCTIFVPYFFDWHPEHVETMVILYNALLRIKNNLQNTLHIAMYQVSVPVPIECITHGMLMNRIDLVQKWRVFKKVYHSQRIIPIARFIANERINGKIGGGYACEVYSVMSASSWIDKLHHYLLNDIEKNNFKMILSDLSKIRTLERNALLEREKDKGR